MRKLIVIAGPTASGKSKLAIELAKRIDGEIISADSMQIYKYMDIGTAKITQPEMENIPHHMLDCVSPKESFSVGDYVEKTTEIIDNIKKEKTPIICGGTGLYIDSLIYKRTLAGVCRDDEIRRDLMKIKEEKGNEYIYDMLKKVDLETAEKFHISDVPRIIRALEIHQITGKKKSELIDEKEKRFDFSAYYIDIPREVLYERINKRVDQMVGNGLFEEFSFLVKKFDLNAENQSMKAIGYKEIFNLESGVWTKEETIEKIKQFSRNYAKRQFTWFKNQNHYKKIDGMKSLSEMIEEININI